MNILFSCGDFYPNPGGATSLIDDLVSALLRRGHDVQVLTRRWPGFAGRERFHGYTIHRLDYPVLYEKLVWSSGLVLRSLPVLWRIARLLRRQKIDTVCIGLLDMSAWYFLILRPILGFRLVLYLHGGETRLLPQTEESFAQLLTHSLRRADAVVAVSQQLKQEAATYWPLAEARTVVIENAIDFGVIRGAQPWQHLRPYLCSVGRLVPEKDFATLIRAYASVQHELGDVDLVIAGAGRLEPALRELAQLCPRPQGVLFPGGVEREAAIAIMRGSLLFVLSSVTEGFPIVAVEALALGKPVVGTAIPGIRAVVEDGRHGDLFPPGDVQALARLLRLYCQDPAHLRRRIAAVEDVDLTRYDIHQVAAQHLLVIEGRA